jgi:uncharacterized protein (DUF1810 family)
LTGSDPFDLERFVTAQEPVFETALAELRRGRKESHWMWFVFPQLAGLGRSPTARHYGIASIDEARAYLAHPLLGARLRAVVETLQGLEPQPAEAVLGSSIDAMKLRSSLTLFAEAGGGDLFEAALGRWFGGARDEATLGLLGRA